jgi:hypothetical protein
MIGADHQAIEVMPGQLRLIAIRDQLDTILDEAARRELSLPETLAVLVERQVLAVTSATSIWPRCL